MKKKQVGIITFHNSYNCGSMLQTYALHTYLDQQHIAHEVIDFSNAGQRALYQVYGKSFTVKNLIKNFILFFHAKRIRKNYASYEDFKTKQFPLSAKTYYDCSELEDFNYDAVITGSDQVWNITIEDGDDAYFLPWVQHAKKIAYAPSFGARNILEYASDVQKYRDYLKGFDAISIRENNGKKWLKDLIGVDVPVLLDPTLLLDPEDYKPIISQELHLPSKYIFYYSPGYKSDINQLVKQISKKYHLPVIAFNAKSYYTKGMNFSSFQLPELENPSTYLQLIQNATLVITTSFHGTIFSTIFRKKFWTIKNGAMYETDDRVITLMQNLDLEERLIPIPFDSNFDYLQEKDYTQYEILLKQLQKVSKEYLNQNLK